MNSFFLDRKYVFLLGPRLQRFKQKSDNLWNFKCPLCGDSQKSRTKMRGYIYRRKDEFFFKCQNCGISLSFRNFLKTVDHSLFCEYKFEELSERAETNKETPIPQTSIPEFSKENQYFCDEIVIDIPCISSLHEEHEARLYIKNRLIPKPFWNDIYFTRDFSSFIQPYNVQNKSVPSDARVVIPFRDREGKIFGFQGRALNPKEQKRYVSIMLKEDMPKVYGLDRVDLTKPVYVVEGPFDSMFLDNGLAVGDSALSTIILLVGDADYIFVHDNQPRNKDVVKQYKKSIATGKKVCIWDNDIHEKDINDMILAGNTASQLQYMIDSMLYFGEAAYLKLAVWAKFTH